MLVVSAERLVFDGIHCDCCGEMGLNGTEVLMIATRKAFELEISQSAVAGQVPLSQWLTDLMVIYMYQACHILDGMSSHHRISSASSGGWS